MHWRGEEAAVSVYLESGTVQVCCFCYPGESIFGQFPHWQGLGLRVSHGLCKKHKAEMAPSKKGGAQ